MAVLSFKDGSGVEIGRVRVRDGLLQISDRRLNWLRDVGVGVRGQQLFPQDGNKYLMALARELDGSGHGALSVSIEPDNALFTEYTVATSS